jgi:hypothetical protein
MIFGSCPMEICGLPSGHTGPTTTDRRLHKIKNHVYSNPPPADWPQSLKAATRQTLSLYRRAENRRSLDRLQDGSYYDT